MVNNCELLNEMTKNTMNAIRNAESFDDACKIIDVAEYIIACFKGKVPYTMLLNANGMIHEIFETEFATEIEENE